MRDQVGDRTRVQHLHEPLQADVPGIASADERHAEARGRRHWPYVLFSVSSVAAICVAVAALLDMGDQPGNHAARVPAAPSPVPKPSSQVFPESKLILDSSWGEVINDWCGAAGREWTLCYSSFTDDNRTSAAFHQQCDGFNTTVVVARNSLNYTFGGLAVGSWSKDVCCGHTSNTCCSSEDKTSPCNFVRGCIDHQSRSNFIFGLWPHSPRNFNRTGTNQWYQVADPTLWPTWGGGFDLTLGRDAAVGSDSGKYQSSCWQGNTYAGQHGEICGSEGDWGATQMEVWRPKGKDALSTFRHTST